MKHTTFSPRQIRATLGGSMTQFRLPLDPQPPEYTPMVIDVTKPYLNEDDFAGEWGQMETIWTARTFNQIVEPEDEVWLPIKLPFEVGDKLTVADDLTILITDVRVQRVRDIGWKDVVSEGFPFDFPNVSEDDYHRLVGAFSEDYEHKHGPDAFDRDWVAIYTF